MSGGNEAVNWFDRSAQVRDDRRVLVVEELIRRRTATCPSGLPCASSFSVRFWYAPPSLML